MGPSASHASATRASAPRANEARASEARASEARASPSVARASEACASVPLRVGSDCSGMGTECFALEALGVPYVHEFCSEVWEPAIRWLRTNRRPRVMYRDVTERAAAPPVDLYVCGFPCQPNSVLNLKKRDGVEHPQRDPMAKALEYIETARPKYWVLENVVGLMHVAKGAVWRALVDRLDALSAPSEGFEGYAWDYRILDPCKHADSPQSRPRVYLCGKRGARHLDWPDEVPLTTRCVDLLDPRAAGQPAAPCYLKMLATWGVGPEREGVIEFCAASRAFSPYKDPRALTDAEVRQIVRADVAPCIIKHDPGPYANHLRRYLTADECLRLQGFDPTTVRLPQVTPLQVRQLCGNAMHCGVLARLLEKLLA